MPIKPAKLPVWPEASAIANSLSGLLAVASRCHNPEKQTILSRDRITSGDLPLHQTHTQTTVALIRSKSERAPNAQETGNGVYIYLYIYLSDLARQQPNTHA